MSDPNWTGRIPRTTRHDYANCGWVYKQTATRRMRIVHAVATLLVIALIAVLLAWRG